MIVRRSTAEIAVMRRAGRLVAEVLGLVEESLRPGVSTAHLDEIAEEHIRKAGGVPSFKGYNGYPSSICISIDREVVHGIPGHRTIADGQVVSIDAGAIIEGYHGDAARTFVVGEVPQAVRDLVATTQLGLEAGIAAAISGNRIWDISAAVEDVALPRGYGVVRPYVGHGIGTEMHEDPQVPNYRTKTKGIELAPGICLAIEPMFTLGSADVETLADGWTVVTRDGSVAAHFEDSIAVTADGPEILTRL
ncbi:MAG: type I methionyl aminopeptidase [Candidatus Limnocylindrales bacterium]|jgi:methionyl aminopeptidase|nr:type I methionyl aminopeptidase [Candidatus Limnocylindrales bacterium]